MAAARQLVCQLSVTTPQVKQVCRGADLLENFNYSWLEALAGS